MRAHGEIEKRGNIVARTKCPRPDAAARAHVPQYPKSARVRRPPKAMILAFFKLAYKKAAFLVLTLALGSGIIANVIFKDHWGRFRPISVTEFGGADRFTPWWDPRGECSGNCSFVAGEPAGTFWTLAPAALAPPQWHLLAYSAALAFGAWTSRDRHVGLSALVLRPARIANVA